MNKLISTVFPSNQQLKGGTTFFTLTDTSSQILLPYVQETFFLVFYIIIPFHKGESAFCLTLCNALSLKGWLYLYMLKLFHIWKLGRGYFNHQGKAFITFSSLKSGLNFIFLVHMVFFIDYKS